MKPYMIGNPLEGAYQGAFDASRKKLRALSIDSIKKNTGCLYNDKTGAFMLKCFGEDLQVPYPQGDVFFDDGLHKPEMSWRLIALNYFSRAIDLPASGRWISYKDQPQGAIFYPNIRQNVIEPMGLFYDQCNKARLLAALKSLDFAILTDKADLCALGYFSPRIPVKIQFWAGDEDFPGAFQLLFDTTISQQMHIEDSVVLCTLTADLIRGAYQCTD